jgi:hypothetical protein
LRKPAVNQWLAINDARKGENAEPDLRMMHEIENFNTRNPNNGQHLPFHRQRIAIIEKQTSTALNAEDDLPDYFDYLI